MFEVSQGDSVALTERADDSCADIEHNDSVPPRPLSEIPTSGWLGVELDITTADPAALNDFDLVEAILAFDKMSSWALARQATLLAEFARRRPADSAEALQSDTACPASPYAADEIGVALRLSRGTAAARLLHAQLLDTELAATRQAWQDGHLDATKVRAILDATFWLDPTKTTAVQERVLPRAPQQTAAQLRAALGRAIIAVDPAGAAQRHQQARRGRRVAITPEPDGMASLWALLTAPDALASYELLTRLARGMGADDPRGMDARRADLLAALLTGRLTVAAPDGDTDTDTTPNTAADAEIPVADKPEPADPEPRLTPDTAGSADEASNVPEPAPGRMPMPAPVTPGKPLIQVVVPFDTLTGAAEYPGDLIGYGPIPAPLAREIAANGIWKRLVTDPLSGTLLDHGRTTYRPPAALADFIRARDAYCRYPTCRHRAADSELDHTIAYAHDGGHTSQYNLYDGCGHHHHLKHDAPGWTVTQHRDGRITWTTPTGHSYTSEPYDYRVSDDLDLAAFHRPPDPPPPQPAPEVDADPPF
jgi:hypothetical protein